MAKVTGGKEKKENHKLPLEGERGYSVTGGREKKKTSFSAITNKKQGGRSLAKETNRAGMKVV